jgi:DMSO reductase anchor subunit
MPILNLGGLSRFLVGLLSAIVGLAATFATGATYRLHARPAWDQGLTVATFPLGAISTGSLFGFFIARWFAGLFEVPSYAWIGVGLFLVLALVVTWLRSMPRSPESVEGRLSKQLVLGSYFWLMIIRVAAVGVALAMIGLGDGAQFLAWIPAFIGEFTDRVLFFKSVIPVTLRGRYL